ncbi:MAG: DUF721 domain-containing protein [Spirochaetota bacterium]
MRFRYKEKRDGRTSPIADVVDEFITLFRLEQSFSLEALLAEWEGIAGPILSVHTKPVRIEQETLYIESDHPVFSNDIIMIKGMIVDKVRMLFGVEIRDVRIIKVSGNKNQ